MYRAKDLGRNSFRVPRRDLAEQARHRSLEKALRPALKDDELQLYYQPILDHDRAMSAPRRCCAGTTPSRATCCRRSSSRWPRSPA